MKIRTLFALALSALSLTCHAADIEFEKVVLLQPDFVLQEHGVDVGEFAAFIKSTQVATTNAWKASKLPASSGFVVVAVREGGKVNAWLDVQPDVPAQSETKTIQAIRSLAPFNVRHGTVLFALQFSAAGAKVKADAMPNPKAWRTAAKTRAGPIEVEDLVKLVWP